MFDDCIYFNLVALTRRVSKIWQEEFERLGLTPSHGYLLFAMVEKPDAAQKELGELVALEPSTITRLIDQLVHKGFVNKTSRGKGASFSVTAEGVKEYQKIKSIMDGLYKSMQAHFGKEAFEEFVADLHSARRSFNGENNE